MQKHCTIQKRVGQTPLAALEALRGKNPSLQDVPLAYAGRLDPMASGTLLVLIGDECKHQEKYHGLDKAYTFEVLFNFSSDTGDVLGIAGHTHNNPVPERALKALSQELQGVQSLPYPAFSSKPVDGKPLFLWALEGRLNEVDIPTKETTIYRLQYTGSRTTTKQDLEEYILKKIETIPAVTEDSKMLGADFRRDTIRTQWKKLFGETIPSAFQIARFSCICSSGTYMRTLAALIGERLGTQGLALSIHRGMIGNYRHIFGDIGFWSRKY